MNSFPRWIIVVSAAAILIGCAAYAGGQAPQKAPGPRYSISIPPPARSEQWTFCPCPARHKLWVSHETAVTTAFRIGQEQNISTWIEERKSPWDFVFFHRQKKYRIITVRRTP